MPKKSLVFSAVLASFLYAGLPAGAKDVNDHPWSGKWVMDKKSSNAPEGLQDLQQRIKQDGTNINIESTFAEPANGIVPLLYLGIMTTNLKLNADGSEVQNQIGPFMQVSKTTMNGNTMETDWKAEVKGEPVQGHWTRTLSDDGKRMTLKITESSTQGQHGEAEIQFKKK